jgi:hypothetical protein
MMKTMFGFFPDDVEAVLARVVSAPAWASNTFLADPSEQQERLSTARLVAPAPAPFCRAAGVAPSARDAGLKSLAAATKPSTVPSPTQANV